MASSDASGSNGGRAEVGPTTHGSSDSGLRARLPRGSNSLPQDLIAEIQRQRLLEAVALEVGEHGYAATSVASIIERAGVSRKTFYELFSDKDKCYSSALGGALDEHMHLLGAIVCTSEDDAWTRLSVLLRTHLSRLNDDLVRARAFFVESASASAMSREVSILWLAFSTRLGDLISECVLAAESAWIRPEAAAMIMLLGGLNALVASSLCGDSKVDLVELEPVASLVIGRGLGLAEPSANFGPDGPAGLARARRDAERQ